MLSQASKAALAEKNDVPDENHLETIQTGSNPTCDDEEKPELHARTYVALAAILLESFVLLVAVQGPTVVLTNIGESLHNTAVESWVPNSLNLAQAVLGPLVASASDTFQVRKTILVGACLIAMIGSAIAPGSTDIYRLIAAQTLIGVGFSTGPLSYCVASEILPRKWRPLAQAYANIASNLGAMTGILSIGAWTRDDPVNGWKKFYWLQMAFWAASAIGIFVGYRPPKRHTLLDHLSFWQKLAHLDLPGFFLLAAGLALFLAGMNLGGGIYPWANYRVLIILILGLVVLAVFFIYEWKGTKTGIMHHQLFKPGRARGRTFSICLGLMFIEGMLAFSFTIFYPLMTSLLFESDAFLLAARILPFWIASGISTLIWGSISTKFRTIREPLFIGFLILTGGVIGWACIQPDESLNAIAFAGVAGFGFGVPLILIIVGVQLSTPHHLIATATALTTSARAVAGSVMIAIGYAAYGDRISVNLPGKVAPAALKAGLPASSLQQFITALNANDKAALAKIPGVTPAIIGAAMVAFKQALADSIRVAYIIAAPFGIVACIMCLFLGDLRKTMNYHIDAPVEDLHAKVHHEGAHAS